MPYVFKPLIDGTLTANFGDNQANADIEDQAQAIVYVDYVKGTEEYCELQFEFAPIHDITEFFPLSYIAGEDLTLNEEHIRIPVGGRRRLAIPCSLLEHVLRISARAVNPGVTPGSVKIYQHNSYYLPPKGVRL